MEEIRLGIVGMGNMGFAHAKCIYRREIIGLRLTAVCDIQKERLEQCSTELSGVKCYKNFCDMLDGSLVDAVLIATPHPHHSEMAIAAFQKGLHVLVEKPADIMVSKARRMNEVAKASGKKFGIMFNQRTYPLHEKARELVQNGTLGELKRSMWIITNWYRTQHYYESGGWRATWGGEGGGVLLNQAPHNLDVWQWICGMPVSVRATCNVAKYHQIEVEDEATLFVRYENGATGVFVTSTGELPGTNRLEIVGTKGKIVLEQGVLKHWRLPEDERSICFYSNDSYVQCESVYEEYMCDNEDMAHKGILQNFVNSILYGEELIAPGSDGIKELMLSNAAYLSSWKDGVEIALPIDEKEFEQRISELRAESVYYKEQKYEKLPDGEYSHSWQVRW